MRSKGFGFGATNTLNVMADAMRLAFADRADWMADADFAPVPRKGLIATATWRCATTRSRRGCA